MKIWVIFSLFDSYIENGVMKMPKYMSNRVAKEGGYIALHKGKKKWLKKSFSNSFGVAIVKHVYPAIVFLPCPVPKDMASSYI